MSEKERLIELIGDFDDDAALCDICDRLPADCEGCTREQLAEFLIENGVIVLPCKVGDVLYIADKALNIIRMEKTRTFFIGHPSHNGNMPHLAMIRTNIHDIPIDNVGKTVFLTQEAAEKALEGGAE